jgi:prophage regulatory protein
MGDSRFPARYWEKSAADSDWAVRGFSRVNGKAVAKSGRQSRFPASVGAEFRLALNRRARRTFERVAAFPASTEKMSPGWAAFAVPCVSGSRGSPPLIGRARQPASGSRPASVIGKEHSPGEAGVDHELDVEGHMPKEVLQPVGDLPQAAHSRITQINFTQLPSEGFVRLALILTLFPVSPSTWWRGVRSGRYPRPVKLSAYCTAWRVEDIRELLERTAKGEAV